MCALSVKNERAFVLVAKMLGKTGFIGAGKVGTALAVLLSRQGYKVVSVYDQNVAAASALASLIKGCCITDTAQQAADAAELIFITTPDSVIPAVAAELKWHKGQSVIHCSGADSTAILEPARKAGAMVAAFHPLQTFAGAKEAMENIPGSTFSIESEEPLQSVLKKMAGDLGGNWITLKAGDKAAYHAAAVLTSNYLVTLVKMATDLWKTFSIPTDQATKALLPLLRGTIHNIETIGLPDCLTGPVARGDAGTVSKHLQTIKAKTPELLTAYKALGTQTVPIAAAKGTISKEQARELELLFKVK
jgi:predicted short-subunit dehydrogenase-like oxidoreductase (DUF2520 family)